MNAIETFLSNWESNTKPVPDKFDLRLRGNLEVRLSKSGRANTVRLNALRSLKRKNGEATKFLKWLTNQADSNQFTLTLCAQPFGWDKDFVPGKDKLQSWIARFGFKTKFEYPDEEGYEMVREPRSKKKKKS